MMLNTDKISSWMGAPPHHWKQNEIQQIKHIHRCYRNAYSNTNNLRDEVEIIDTDKPQGFDLNGKKLNVKINHHKKPGEAYEEGDEIEQEAKKDEEDFLPRDSPLRSKDGDKKAPANPVFKDYEGFINSCSFDFWRNHFENQNNDKFLAETAQTIVANICNAQSRNEMRVHNGHVPLRKKREHITPLALVLHDIKMWATHDLRTANVNNEDTYQDLRCRIKYLESLAHKEVWGDAAIVFGAGMRAVAHDKLFRLFLTAREALERAEEYAYRGYSRRSSREKLHKIGNLLKDVVMNEMRILSGRMTLEQKMIDPKTARLQPTDLLNSIENQGFVDFKNPVNVLMYKLCQNPLVKAALTAEYDKPDVIDAIENIGTWNQQNLFCRRGKDEELVGEPDFRMDQRREVKIMPEIYGPTAADLKRRIRDVDPKAPVPDSPKRVIARMKAAYGSEEHAAKVIKLVMKNAAAIQELIPSIYAMHQLWILAGDGGDFTVYDTMRENVIRVMSDTMERVITVQKSGLSLMREIQRLAELKEKNMKEEALKTRKMKYKPAWVMNHKFIGNELFDHCQNTYKNSLARLAEVAQDARDYSLTTDQLSDKVKDAQKVLDALTGFHGKADAPTPIVEVTPKGEAPVRTKKDDWLHSEEENFGGFGDNNAFGDQYSSHFGDDTDSFNVGAAKYDDDDSDF